MIHWFNGLPDWYYIVGILLFTLGVMIGAIIQQAVKLARKTREQRKHETGPRISVEERRKQRKKHGRERGV